jgi:5-formyltetrahydrofolate cyclo-ligase
MPPASTHSEKIALRMRFRALRRSLDESTRQRADQSINAAIEALVAEHAPRRITGFLAFDGEPDISPALSRINELGVEVYLPVIGAGEPSIGLSFRRWPAAGGSSTPAELRRNDFGIQEPVVGDSCPVNGLDIILLPLVAWDGQGGRLGMGAGYYDRALADVANTASPMRIGVAYGVQKADALPMTSLDVPLHGIVTETGLFTCTV